MIERDVDIQTAAGEMNSFITYPEEGGPFPVVIFHMDAPGKREELHDMARRIATVGYYVVLPNRSWNNRRRERSDRLRLLHGRTAWLGRGRSRCRAPARQRAGHGALSYRKVREFVMRPGDFPRMLELRDHLTNAMVCEDTRAVLDFVAGEECASPGPAGAVGYCMSGPFVFAAAAEFPERIRASASLHGIRLCTDAPDSPHRRADRIRGEIYFGCAEHDEHAPPEMIEALQAHLATTDIDYRIEWYPGTGHGFVFPQRAKMYDKAAAERHWERLFALFRRNLGGH